MSKPFWILAAAWSLAIVASTPVTIEWLDRRGLGFTVPGLSATSSEIVFAVLAALLPPVAVAVWLARSRRLRA
jgi:hypothetical protein